MDSKHYIHSSSLLSISLGDLGEAHFTPLCLLRLDDTGYFNMPWPSHLQQLLLSCLLVMG